MSFTFGPKSKVELRGVHPRLVQCVRLAIDRSVVDFGVHDGLRTAQEQREYVRTGTSTTAGAACCRFIPLHVPTPIACKVDVRPSGPGRFASAGSRDACAWIPALENPLELHQLEAILQQRRDRGIEV